MEKTTSNKIIRVILSILSLLVIVLSTALYLQGRQLSKLKEGSDVNDPAESLRTVIKPDSVSSEKSPLRDDAEIYKNKIKKLETQIAQMQDWQDYLEETLNEYDEKADSADSIRPQTSSLSRPRMDEIMRRSYFSRFDAFFEENNYAPEVKEKLVDLYIERQNAMRDRLSDMQGFPSVKSNVDEEELRRRSEEINTEYDEKISDLLSKEGYAALKEYEKVEMERSFIMDFKRMLGDDKLEREQEKELIAMMYNDRQNNMQEMAKKMQPLISGGGQPDKETMERLQRESLETLKKLYGSYTSSAEGVLTESQMQKFEGYVNMRKASLDNSMMSGSIIVTDSDE